MKDTDAFDGKKLSDLLKEIHDNAVEKRTNISSVITQLTGLIKTAGDATMLAPLIKDFYDVGVKNDDQIVKVATIVQRLLSAESYSNPGDPSEILSEAEKDRLLKNALEDIKIEVAEIDEELDTLKTKK